MTQPRRWLVHRRFDLALVLFPVCAALVALAVVHAFQLGQPLWAYLLIYVSFDVSHVWGTLYLTYLDREAFQRRRGLYVMAPPLAFLLAFAAHALSPGLFWTLMAYYAIFHFARQQYGFIAIYKALARERSPLDRTLDRWAVQVGTFGPVLMWHAHPESRFDWFDLGESFLFRLPPWSLPWLQAAWGGVACVWCLRQWYLWRTTRSINPGKLIWMVATWVCWYVGLRLTDHLFVSTAFLNLLHGIPYLGLVWRRTNLRWQGQEGGRHRVVSYLAQRHRWLAFYLVLLGLAVVEQVLWDGLVWGKYLPELVGLSPPTFSALALSGLVAALATPQLVHYGLDAFVWKMDEHNPDLRAMVLEGES